MRSVMRSVDQGFDFIGKRLRHGDVEIVYDDGVARRMVWRVTGRVPEAEVDEAIAHAARELRVLPALYAELRKRRIGIKVIAG